MFKNINHSTVLAPMVDQQSVLCSLQFTGWIHMATFTIVQSINKFTLLHEFLVLMQVYSSMYITNIRLTTFVPKYLSATSCLFFIFVVILSAVTHCQFWIIHQSAAVVPVIYLSGAHYSYLHGAHVTQITKLPLLTQHSPRLSGVQLFYRL